MKRLLFWLTLYTALLGGSYMAYHLLLPVRVSFHAVILGAMVIYLYKRGLPNSPLTLAALAMLIAVALAIPTALDPRMALENGWSWLVNLLALLALIQLCRSGYSPILFKAHFVAGGVVAASAIFEFMLMRSRPQGIFGNISITGAYAAALIIPAYHAARERQAFARYPYYLLVVALAVTVVMGDNRGALLSVGVASLAYITFTWQESAILKLALWLGAGALLIGGLVLIGLRPEHATGDVERWDLWLAGGDMIQTYPLGVGPGLFAQGYRLLGTSGENRFADAHNQVITLGAELGAPGLAAGAVMLLVGLHYLIGLTLSRSQLAALAALLGIAAHMLVDSFPAVSWALLVGLYAAYVLQGAELNLGNKGRKLLTALAMLTLLWWSLHMFQFDRAQVSYEMALNSGRYYDAYEAIQLDPDMKLYGLELARLNGQKVLLINENLALYGLTMYGRRFK